MAKLISTLICEHNKNSSVKTSKTQYCWRKGILYKWPMNEYPEIKITKNLVEKYNFTRSDIALFIDKGVINLKKEDKKFILYLIKKGLLDFYRVGSISIKRQFTKRELKEILQVESFYRTAKAGMKCEPVALLNKRVMLLYQKDLNMEIITKLNENNELTNSLIHHKKRFKEMARKNKDKTLELYLECI